MHLYYHCLTSCIYYPLNLLPLGNSGSIEYAFFGFFVFVFVSLFSFWEDRKQEEIFKTAQFISSVKSRLPSEQRTAPAALCTYSMKAIFMIYYHYISPCLASPINLEGRNSILIAIVMSQCLLLHVGPYRPAFWVKEFLNGWMNKRSLEGTHDDLGFPTKWRRNDSGWIFWTLGTDGAVWVLQSFESMLFDAWAIY